MVNPITIHGIRNWWSNFYWTGISWFSSTGRRKDQGLELQLNAVQNCDQVIVQAQV